MQTYAGSRERLAIVILFVWKKNHAILPYSTYFLCAGTVFACFALYTYTRHSRELRNNLNVTRAIVVEALTSNKLSFLHRSRMLRSDS